MRKQISVSESINENINNPIKVDVLKDVKVKCPTCGEIFKFAPRCPECGQLVDYGLNKSYYIK